MKFSLTFLLLLSLSGGCKSQNNQLIVTEIMKGLFIYSENYVYSEEAKLEIGNDIYSLRSKAIYPADGDIKTFALYKPEGVLDYSQTDIKADLKLLEYTGFPIKLNCSYDGKTLLIDQTEVKVKKVGNYLISTIGNNGSVTIYKLSKKQ